MIFKNNKLKYDKMIIDFLKQDQLLKPRKDQLLTAMAKKFKQYEPQTEKVFDELNNLIKDNPVLIVDSTKSLFNRHSTFTKMFDSGRRRKLIKKETIIDKIDNIKDNYECLNILKLASFLLSNKRVNYSSLTEGQAILPHLKQLGLTKTDNENLRLLRNAKSHTYSVSNDNIIDSDGNEISFLDIDKLHLKIEKIISWWSTFVIFSIWFLPQFGILVILGLYSSLIENKSSWLNYIEGIKRLFDDIIVEQKKEEEKRKNSLKAKIKRFKSKIYFIVKYKFLRYFTTDTFDSFFIENAYLNYSRLSYHFENFSNEISVLSENMSESAEKQRLMDVSIWLKKNHKTLKEVGEFCRDNPAAVSKFFKEKKLKKK